MKTDTTDIRETVQERYGNIATALSNNEKVVGCCTSASCCGPAAAQDASLGIPRESSPDVSQDPTQDPILSITDISVNYAGMELSAIPREAIEASLGCANPLVFAQLKEGETILDLGSGGGIDVLMASTFVGETGRVYGLDMTDEMLRLANENKAKMGVTNVDFLKGYIEDIPLKDEMVDAVISNCVINLCEDKSKALAEAYRVIKQGGRLRVADVVSLKEVDPEFRKNAEMWCGCLAGTISPEEYEAILLQCGFKNINIEIAHVYSKEIIRSEFLGGLGSIIGSDGLDALDGAFAGALIRADK